jgi:glycosyltransferase involved in cell wall biosynthesis
MKILFLNHNVVWKGGFFRAYHWGRHLRRFGHEVTILTISEKNYFRFSRSDRDGITLVETPDLLWGRLRSGWDPWDTFLRMGYLLNHNYDIIHCVDSRPNVIIPGLMMKLLGKGKLVIDWGDSWGRGGTIRERATSFAERLFEPIETFFEERFRTFGDGHVVLAELLRKRLHGLGVADDKIITIRHGADTSELTPRDRAESRRRLGIDADLPVLGYVGALLPPAWKFLQAAFALVRQKVPGVRLILIGNCNVEVPPDCAQVVKTGQVTYDVLQDYISAGNLMLLPLNDSTANKGKWPSKVCDYLAAGRAVVSTDVGDIAGLLRQVDASLISKPEPADFAAAVIAALANPRIGEFEIRGREIADEQLAWDKVTRTLEGFYEEVLMRNGSLLANRCA